MTQLDQAWESFLASLAAAKDVVTGPLGGRDDRELAEGLRHVTRLTSVALEMIVEKGDPAHPEITRWMSPWRKLMGDNPGTIYDAALISPEFTYEISGEIGDADYLGICIYGTSADGSRRVATSVDREIAYDDGRFTLVLAATRPSDLPEGATFVELPEDATDLLIRQYFRATDRGEASYDIRVLPEAGPPPALDGDVLATRLIRAGEWVRDLIEVEATVSALSESGAPEQMKAPSKTGTREVGEIDWNVINRVQPTPAMDYSGAWFADLADDEAILVEGVLPECDYFSVQWLSRWMESGDYHHHTVALSGEEIATDGDGRFTVVIAHHDPGVPNWISTTGIRHGNAVGRALHAAEPAQITFRRARLAEESQDPAEES
ncbi:MAG: hypothetical protein V9G04_07760 [Nocardioides sp.]|jgi:hypothetical protein